MRIIELIKGFFRDTPVDRSKIQVFLRQGTADQISQSKPHYIGEIVVCLDAPFLCVGTVHGFYFVPVGETYLPAAVALQMHYKKISW